MMGTRLSQGMDALRRALDDHPNHLCEALVIGSGYGGAVAAQRLAERGVAVTVLERGLEYLSGEFPDGLGKAFGQIRVDNSATSQVSGNETALFDVRLGDKIGVLVGNALGGGSQINANVAIEPDARVFEKRTPDRRIWPLEIHAAEMARHFLRAHEGLGTSVFKGSYAGIDQHQRTRPQLAKPLKTQRLAELAARMREVAPQGTQCDTDDPLHLTVRHVDPNHDQVDSNGQLPSGSCVGCGECVAGCNFNAKQTLTHTYLRRAHAAGANLYTGVTALRLARSGDLWEVTCVATQDRKRQRHGAQVAGLVLRARRVIVSAGSLGSTELLFRSRECGLRFSDRLGQGLATNGDNLAVAYLVARPVNGIGQGASGFARRAPNIGPTISGSIRVRHTSVLEQEVLVQDAAIPRALAGIFHELITTSGMLTQLASWQMRPVRSGDGRQPLDWAALQASSLAHTQTLLLMGHDSACGSITWDKDASRVRLSYPPTESRRVAALQEPYLKAIRGKHGVLLRNPVLDPIPRKISAAMDGPAWAGASFSVHPLGGCAMGENAAHGVVDHAGRVFDPAGLHSTVHEGLYVLDGAVVPTSLGVNPLLTITALAERAIEVLLAEDFQLPGALAQRSSAAGSPPMMLDKKTFAAAPRHVPVRFTEVMRTAGGGGAIASRASGPGSGFEWRPRADEPFEPADAKLILHLPLPSLDSFAAEPTHTIVLPTPGAEVHGVVADHDEAHFIVDRATSDPCDQRTSARWADMQVIGGTVTLLPTRRNRSWRRADSLARTLVTWFVSRGAEDLWARLRAWLAGGNSSSEDSNPSKPGSLVRLLGFFRLAWHASEARTMRYTLHLRDRDSPIDGVSHVLIGQKVASYPAQWRQILALLLPPALSGRGGQGVDRDPLDAWLPRLNRTNVWLALSELNTKVFDGQGNMVGRGTLGLDLIDMTRLHAPQLGLRGNTPDALITLAGYPLWMLRFLIKTRMWDFRLPEQPLAPKNDQPTPWPQKFPSLEVADTSNPGGWIKIDAEVGPFFEVARSSREPEKKVALRMIRYRARHLESSEGKTPGLRQFKAILLLNGFAQSTLPFVAEELKRQNGDCNMASWLYEQGFDVWLFEYRVSAVLDSSKLPCSMDDIAAHDIPAAVDHVLEQLRKDAGLGAYVPAQIYAFAHCVGAASLSMSLLGGFLQYRENGSDRGYGKLAGAVFSQMQMYLVGTASAQTRMPLSAIARDVLGIDYFRLSATERAPNAFESVLDRLFASLPVQHDQECPHERFRFIPHTDTCTCKRMTGIVSPLLHHARILRETHEKLSIYFGRANTSLLVHGTRCLEHERLVDADGQNVYVTEENLRRHLDMPVALLHGRHNALFSVESATRTFEQLQRIHPALCRSDVMHSIIANDFAHFDCTVGYGPAMRSQILEPIADFLDTAWRYNGTRLEGPTPRIKFENRVMAPRSGPVVGWTRRAPPEYGRAGYLVRLWIEVDESASHRADHVLTYVNWSEDMQLWPVLRIPLAQWQARSSDLAGWTKPPQEEADHVAVAVADVFIADAHLTSVKRLRAHMLSIHPYTPAPAGDGRTVFERGATKPRESPGPALADSVPRYLPFKLAVAAFDLDSALTSVKPAASESTESPWLKGRPVDAVDRRVFQQRIAELRAREKTDIGTATRANPGTTSRQRRSARQRRDGPTGEARIDRFAVAAPEGNTLQFVAACCRHPGLPVERSRASFTLLELDRRMNQQDIAPQFMLMLGDQIYADATAGLADSPSLIEKMAGASRTALNSEGMRRITSRLPTYMVIDDHEIAEGWSRDLLRGSAAYQTDAEHLSSAGMACFAAYQWLHSPRNQNTGGFDYNFSALASDVFVLDGRTHRNRHPADGEPVICSDRQFLALRQWLDEKPDTLKIIACGSVVVPGLVEHADDASMPARQADNWQLAPQQRAELLLMVGACQSSRVVLLSGDYHCAAISTIRFQHDGHLKREACAIVTPPLYAPYPAINAHPKDVCAAESLDLGNGWTADIATEAWTGDGYAEISAQPLLSEFWVHVSMRLMRSDARRAPEWITQRRSLRVG